MNKQFYVWKYVGREIIMSKYFIGIIRLNNSSNGVIYIQIKARFTPHSRGRVLN